MLHYEKCMASFVIGWRDYDDSRAFNSSENIQEAMWCVKNSLELASQKSRLRILGLPLTAM